MLYAIYIIPFYLKGNGDGMATSPFYRRENGDGIATSPFYLKGNGVGWPLLHSI